MSISSKFQTPSPMYEGHRYHLFLLCLYIQRFLVLGFIVRDLAEDLVPNEPICEDSRRKFSKLVPNHILGNGYLMINFTIMDLKFKADKVWEDGGCAGLGFDRGDPLTRCRTNDWQTTQNNQFSDEIS